MLRTPRAHDISFIARMSYSRVPQSRAVRTTAMETKDVVISRPSPVECSATPRAQHVSDQAVTLSLVTFQIAR
jgi:hypothetical protein